MKTREWDETRRAAWAESGGGALTRDGNATSRAGAAAAAAVQSPPLDPDAEPRANLWRYAKWKLKDFVRERAGWIAAIGAAFLAMFWAKYDPTWLDTAGRSYGFHPMVNGHPMTEADYFRQQLTEALTPTGFLGALIASHSLVSRDRERGFQRFLFAKPLSPVRYYLQSFLINGAGYVGVMGLLIALAAATFMRGVPLLGGLAVAAGTYAALGGFVFLLSTLVRYDAGLGVVGVLVGAIAQEWGRHSSNSWWPLWSAIGLLLPPVSWIDTALRAASQGRPLDALGAALGPIAYGAACVAAGLAILRRRSIAN